MMHDRAARIMFVVQALTLAFIVAALGGGDASAQDITVQVGVRQRDVYVGQPVLVQVSVDGSKSPEEPVWPPLSNVDITPRGGQASERTFTSFINGHREERHFEGYTFNYQVAFQKPGVQTIPPLTVFVDGKEYRSNAVSVNVREPEDRQDVRFRIEVDNTAPYVGEAIELRATLYLTTTVKNASVGLADFDGSFESFDAPGADDLTNQQATVNFLGSAAPGQRGQATLDGVVYQTFTVRKWIVPLREGPQTLGPATLNCEVIVRQSRSFFEEDQVERAAVPSNEIHLNVKALPKAGQPANFTGLIGRYRVSAAASQTDVNIGDPITLTIRVGSSGAVLRDPHLNLQSQPEFSRNFRISEASSEPKRERGELVYEQVIRPLSDSVKEIPPIEISYFDTASGRYAVASTNAIPLNVRPTRIVTARDAVGAESTGPLGSEVESAAGGIGYNYDADASLVDQRFDLMEAIESPVWIAAIGGPPALYFAAALLMVWRKRGEGDQSARRRRRALATARSAINDSTADAPAADRIGAAVRHYIADRFDRPAAGLTTADCVQLTQQADAGLAERLRDILDHCDAARYSGTTAAEIDHLHDDALQLLAEIDRATARREEVRA